MKMINALLLLLTACLLGKAQADCTSSCQQGVFKTGDQYKSFDEFTSFPNTEGAWEPGKILTFKAKLGPSSDPFPAFVVHLANGRTLGKTRTDFNCRIDTGYDDECPSVKDEPWCCYSSAQLTSGQGLRPPWKCSGQRCRDLRPVGRCRAACMDHLMYHIVFEANRSEGGGEIKVYASYRYLL